MCAFYIAHVSFELLVLMDIKQVRHLITKTIFNINYQTVMTLKMD